MHYIVIVKLSIGKVQVVMVVIGKSRRKSWRKRRKKSRNNEDMSRRKSRRKGEKEK